MPIYDKIVPLMRMRDWKACHAFLDGALAGDDAEQRRSAHLWRALIFEEEGRYDEALDYWRTHRREFGCQTNVNHQIARLFAQIGRPSEAIEELRGSPFGEEMDRHPAFVLDGIYFYCYLLAREGRAVPEKLLSALPDDFMYIQFRGNRTSKAQLLSMVGKGREAQG